MNEVGEERFESLDEELRNHFVQGVAQANGVKFVNGFGMRQMRVELRFRDFFGVKMFLMYR